MNISSAFLRNQHEKLESDAKTVIEGDVLFFSFAILDVSYNRPKLSPCATWDPHGVVFADNSIVSNPMGIFVTINDTVYVAAEGLSKVRVWPNGGPISTIVLSTNSSAPYDVFVTSSSDIYIDNGASQRRVDKWTLNATNATVAMYVDEGCYGVFVDVGENLYCSVGSSHQVVSRSLIGPHISTSIVAGNGTPGNDPNLLIEPRGIFIDLSLQLYVADSSNNRIQCFPYRRRSGITVAGYGATGTISLNSPTDVILDADGYLFIVEYNGRRIVASGPNGFRCIIGCTAANGSPSTQLQNPTSLSFDSAGNLFVTDFTNNLVLKFLRANDSCGKHIKGLDRCIRHSVSLLHHR